MCQGDVSLSPPSKNHPQPAPPSATIGNNTATAAAATSESSTPAPSALEAAEAPQSEPQPARTSITALRQYFEEQHEQHSNSDADDDLSNLVIPVPTMSPNNNNATALHRALDQFPASETNEDGGTTNHNNRRSSTTDIPTKQESNNIRSSRLSQYRRNSTLSNSNSGLAAFANLSDFLKEEGYRSRSSTLNNQFPLLAVANPNRGRNRKKGRSENENGNDGTNDCNNNDGSDGRPSMERRNSGLSLDGISLDTFSSLLNNDDDHYHSTHNNSNNKASNNAAGSAANNQSMIAESIKDFTLQLKFWGKSTLDEEAFHFLLDDIGYSRSRDGLFQSFLEEIESASPAYKHDSTISIKDLQYLYQSEPYRLPSQAAFNNGEALMSYVEALFRRADKTKDNELDLEELRVFLGELFDGREVLESEVIEAMDVLDIDKDGKINLEEFKSFMLRANVNDSCDISSEFNEGLLSPSHTSEDEFVTELETYTKTHRAVTHHLLTNLACASFGKRETADILLRFLSAYSHFNSGFIDNVQALLSLLDNQDHIEILQENLEEEMGQYDLLTLLECEKMGIPRDSVEGIPHRELFKGLVEFVETTLQKSYSKFIPTYICQQLNEAIGYAKDQGKLGLLAALYFGSELIVPEIYSSILQGLRNSIGVSNEEVKFLILHIDMDQDHATALREIIVANCRTKADRLTLVQCTKKLLEARVSFYDSLIKYASLDPLTKRDTSELYNDEAKNWVRSEPTVVSDFTCRPIVFHMCKNHVKGSTVLDIGCGEGYVARHLATMGATKIVGVDICSKMIEAAKSHPDKRNAEYYVEGDAANLKETLLQTSNQSNLMPCAQFDVGLFDLSVAVFLFSYLTITDMEKAFKDVFSLLKPGGHFVFSVPHPFMSNHDDETLGFVQNEKSSYFATRDKLLEGHISTLSGDRLKIRMYCKTFEDYIQIARKYGFEIDEIKEARVGPDHLNNNPELFDAVNGIPLHLVVKLRKPESQIQNNTKVMAAANTLNMLPKKINWSRAAMKNPKNAFYLQIPDQVKQELYRASLECYERGMTVDSIDLECDFCSQSFTSLKSFAVSVRNILLHETGLVLLKGLDLDVFGVEKKMVTCSKIAYYLLCNHIGAVDGSARGRLFDVKDTNVNAKTVDNVLFSVSNCKADWHTDGASKDKVYDAVGLLCIHPASVGGKSMVSNACNAFDELKKMPKFLMNELLRPVSRDILENGKGKLKRRLSIGSKMSRADSVLSLRVSYNSYPIFDVHEDRMRFRYMRYWIESAHKKMHWKVPTLLSIAMDTLDDTLSKGCCFHEPLEHGDVLICNNATVAHGRDSFHDNPDKPSRHLVRAWMKLQKVDLLKPSNQSV